MGMIIANFEKGSDCTDAKGKLWQWDYGQVLRIQGLKLRTAEEIHFSIQPNYGEAVRRIGVTRDGVTDVTIPDSMLEENGDGGAYYYIYAFVYVVTEDSGETIRKISIKVNTRPEPKPFDKPEEAELFREAIKAVNEAADRAEAAASKEEIAATVKQWLSENDIGGVDEEELARAVVDYFTAHPLTAAQVGADAAGTAAGKVLEHNTSEEAHNDIRQALKELKDWATAFADSDDETLDQLSEIIAYIKSNKTLIENVTNGKVGVSDIVDDLTTNVANKPLSAAQGVILKGLIDGVTKTINESLIPQHIWFRENIEGLQLDKAEKINRVELTAADTQVELEPNKEYVFIEAPPSVTYTLKAPDDTTIANIYTMIFPSGDPETEIVHPADETLRNTDICTPKTNSINELSISEGIIRFISDEVMV